MTPFLPKRLPIRPRDRVLEIGSGGRPHNRADVLTDRHCLDNSQREGKSLKRDKRPLVIADGEALPFADKSFDYCICMHVLEHVRNPARLLDEMQRVARAGYIEAPTELFDWLFAVPPYTEIHHWLINLSRGELIISPKTGGDAPQRFAFLFDYLRSEDGYFERWMEKHPHLFTVQYEWAGTIRHRLLDRQPAELRDDHEAADYLSGKMTIRNFYWGSGLWGLKRWLYAHCLHPVWRKRAKRAVWLITGKHHG
ncbi:MAG: class I SAM-dependent methyltransferase [Candidatus Sumerlaeota bacterium]|nr:class I SAM-dependent methyltransferase [Candidatus Sumerlaeota bacterium]